MAKLYTKLQDKFNGFFDDDYVAQKGFYVKAKSSNFTGKVTAKDNNPQLEATFNEKAKVMDHKVDASIKLTSKGVHTLEGTWNLKELVDKTKLNHVTNWNSGNHDHDTTVTVTNKSIKDMALRFEYQYFKGGNWTLTNHIARKVCSKLHLGGDFRWDGQKSEVNSLNLGVFYHPNAWIKILFSHSIDGAIDGKTNWSQTGTLSFKNRFIADKTTILGFDYAYNLESKKSALIAGVETTPALGVLIKAKATSGGDIEATARLTANPRWTILASAGTHVSNVSGKQEPLLGIGIEGKLS